MRKIVVWVLSAVFLYADDEACKKILDEELFLEYSDNTYNEYVVYSDDNVSQNRRLLFSTIRFGGTSRTPSFFDIGIDKDVNETNKTQIFDIINTYEQKGGDDDDLYDNSAEVDAYLWANEVKIFSLDNKIYLNLFSAPTVLDSGIYNIFVYDKKDKFFNKACLIKRKLAGYDESKNKICQKVVNKQYTQPQEVNLTTVLNKAALTQLEEDISKISKKFRWVRFNIEYNKAFLVDYDNTGKKKLLLRAAYASGAGAGCDYYLHFTYDADKKDKFSTLSPQESTYFYTEHISSCFQKEELVTVEGKNYILVDYYDHSNITSDEDDAMYALYELKRDKNKELISEQICNFIPKYRYEQSTLTIKERENE